MSLDKNLFVYHIGSKHRLLNGQNGLGGIFYCQFSILIDMNNWLQRLDAGSSPAGQFRIPLAAVLLFRVDSILLLGPGWVIQKPLLYNNFLLGLCAV